QKGKDPLPEKKAAQDIPKWDVRATLEGHKDAVWAVHFSPDGKVLATASRDGTVRLFELATGKTLAMLEGHEGDVHQAAFAPDGKTLATAGEDRTVRFWDPATRRELRRGGPKEPPRGAGVPAGGRGTAGSR